jgi:hypothetical protein
MNILLKIVLVPVAAVAVFCAAAYTTGVYEGLTDTPERYSQAESACMDERVALRDRMDCILKAQKRYRDGYLQVLVDESRARAAADLAQQALDGSQAK